MSYTTFLYVQVTGSQKSGITPYREFKCKHFCEFKHMLELFIVHLSTQ